MTRLLASLLLIAGLLLPIQGWAAPALVASQKCGGASGCTTAAANNTGANFLACMVYSGGTPTDSSSNTWSSLTANGSSRLHYVANATVTSSQTYSISGGGGFTAMVCASFSSVKTATPFDQENGGNAAGTSVQTGSVTPSENNELLVTGLGVDGAVTNVAIDSSFSVIDTVPFSGGSNYGASLGYKVQGTAGADNPTWSWTTSASANAVIATFKEAAAAAAETFGFRKRLQQ